MTKQKPYVLYERYSHGFEQKPDKKKDAPKIMSHFRELNIFNRTKLHFGSVQEFAAVLENGFPVVLGSWTEAKLTIPELRAVGTFRANGVAIDIDDTTHLTYRQSKHLEELLYQHCHIVQESFSSSSDYSAKRYHAIILLDKSIAADYEVYQWLAGEVQYRLSQLLGGMIQFDEGQQPAKILYGAYGKKVHVNLRTDPWESDKLLEDFLKLKEEMKEKSKNGKVTDVEVGMEVTSRRHQANYITKGVNFTNLAEAVKQLPDIVDYREWLRTLQAINSLEKEGLINSSERFELLNLIDDGHGKSETTAESVFKYDGVHFASLIYLFNINGVSLNGVFKVTEKNSIEPDITFEIEDYISNSDEVMNYMKDFLSKPENFGKKILFLAPTGTGKTVFMRKLSEWIAQEQRRMKKKVVLEYRDSAFTVFAIPRNSLIRNIKDEWIGMDKHATALTGSDDFGGFGIRQNEIRNADRIVTSMDHAKVVLHEKVQEQMSIKLQDTKEVIAERFSIPSLLVFDECHTGYLDSSFKKSNTRDFLIAQSEYLENSPNGVSIWTTATGWGLHQESFDHVVEIKQKNRQTPFKLGGYKIIKRKSLEEQDTEMLMIIQKFIRKYPDKKLLIYIENKNLIETMRKKLKGVKTLGVYSRPDKERDEQEFEILGGKWPKDIQITFATSFLSAGLSLTQGYDGDEAEVWNYISQSSRFNAIQLVQQSNRHRKKYATYKLFIAPIPVKEEENKEKDSKKNESQAQPFLYHRYVNTMVGIAEEGKEVVELIRSKGSVTPVDKIEESIGLYSDNYGRVKVFIEAIQSNAAQLELYSSLRNYESLIIEKLQEVFKVRLIEMGGTVEFGEEDILKRHKPDKISITEAVKKVSDSDYWMDLKDELRIGVKNGEYDWLMSVVKQPLKKDVEFFLATDKYSHNKAKEVFATHATADIVNGLQNKEVWDRLKEEKSKGIKHGELDKVLEAVDLELQNKINSLLISGESHNEVKKIVKDHVGEERYCFVEDYEKLNTLKDIEDRVSKGLSSVETDIYNLIQEKIEKEKALDFKGSKDVKDWLDNLIKNPTSDDGTKGFKISKRFIKLLDIEIKPKRIDGKVRRLYIVKGFVTESILDKYKAKEQSQVQEELVAA